MANKKELTADAIIKLIEAQIAEAKKHAGNDVKLGERTYARTKAGILEELLDDILAL